MSREILLNHARNHQEQGLKTLKALKQRLDDVVAWAERCQNPGLPEADVPGDIYGTLEGIDRQLLPHLINASQSYAAACWARNEAIDAD